MLENVLLVVAGLVLLIWGADRFVHGAASAARNLGIAPLLIGLTVVAFATSAPEILVSVVAAVQGKPGLAFGNAIGSNIFNIGLVLGLTAMIRPILLESATLRREMPALLAVSLLTVSLFLDSFLSRIDGIVMLIGLVIVMVWLVRLGLRSAANDPIAQDFAAEIPDDVSMPMAVIWLIVGLGTLLIGAELADRRPTPGQEVTLVGDSALTEVYAEALAAWEVPTRQVCGQRAAARGLWQLAQTAGWLGSFE